MNVVTGSFGYIGRYITRELLRRGQAVKTITTHPGKPNPFGEQVSASPYNFERPDVLTQTLEACDALFNTYWVRFNHRQWSFDKALENTKVLFNCARQAGVKLIVQISVTNPSEDDSLPYYRGKALQERALVESGVDYRIIRPTLVYGLEDILVNNIVWTIRKFPFVPVFGAGDYRIRPVFVQDLAKIAVDSCELPEPVVLDAVGPETYTYQALLQSIRSELNRNIPLVRVPPRLGLLLGKVLSLFVRDVILTEDELRGLMANKLTSDQPTNGPTRFSEWLHENIASLGTDYTSELERHFYWRPPAGS
jgi:NADH dehydrogenase